MVASISKHVVTSSPSIAERILLIRGERVILDHDLAKLYYVETKALKRAVRRNAPRFPADFMFELSKDEYDNLRSHIDTSSWGGRRYLPYAFTEQGVAMLSTVLRSRRAILVNIEIMRTFVRLREIVMTHKDLTRRLDDLERSYDSQFRAVFDAIRQLMNPENRRKRRIGFEVYGGS